MKRYYLRVKVESAFSISGHENRDGQVIPSLDYIPGSTLRGALAWHWLRAQPELKDDSHFRDMLDKGLLRCGPLVPDNADKRVPTQFPLVIPSTARTCKHQPGFQTDALTPQGERGHGVRDSLVALIEETAMHRGVLKSESRPDGGKVGLASFEECAKCSSAMDRIKGYYDAGVHNGRRNHWQSRSAKRLITRSKILPTLQSTAPSNLFSREAVDEGQYLSGWLLVDDAIEPWMRQTFGNADTVIASGTEFAVGAARSVGYGRVRVDRCKADRSDWHAKFGDLAARLESFHARLPDPVKAAWSIIPITLLTDTILLDANLRHASAPTLEVLANYWELDHPTKSSDSTDLATWPEGVELFVSAGSLHRVASWNTAEGGKRPRSDDWAVAAGSVFVLAAPCAQHTQLLAACTGLEELGLGERREDGFGQVMVAHPFHTLTRSI